MKRVILFSVLIFIACLLYGCLPPSQAEIEYAIHQTQTAEVKKIKPKTISSTPTTTNFVQCNIVPEIKNNWDTLLCDTFDTDKGYLPTGANPSYGINSSISGGKYIIKYDSKNSTGYTTGFYITQQIFEAVDYLVSIDGRIDSNFRNNTWGLTVRGKWDDGYSFSIDNNGNYFLTYEGASGGNNYLGNIKYGSNSAIKWGEENNITALVEGNNINFYVNGKSIISYEADNSLRKEISYTIWAAEGVKVSYILDNVLIKEK